MSNIIDYLKWRGDLDFNVDPFNAIDSLVLSRLVYIRWEYILKKDETISIEEAYERFSKLDMSRIHNLADDDPYLFYWIAHSERFKRCLVSDFVNEINDYDDMQFCALTIHLNPSIHYVAYRGTDNTLIGWKEDFTMSFQPNVPAQKQALKYLREISKKYSGKLRVGGHSKGGNLAMFASLFSIKAVQKRILSIDNFDGPGLSLELYQRIMYSELYKKVKVYCPQKSIFGRMLYHDDQNRILILSCGKGVYQHDLYTWQVMNNQFIYTDKFDTESEVIDAALKEFLEKVPPKQRKQTIDIVFEVLESTDEDTFKDLTSNWLKNSSSLIKSVSAIEPENRKVVLDSAKTLLMLVFDELKSNLMNKER
ncbi:MAG: Mbeg1-like protein [Traorella sp.]